MLVIDDEADIRLLIRTVLSRHGWEVVEADGGIDGCALLAQRKYSVVQLDVHTPQQDGWTTLTQIREHHDTADLPVIMCTVKSQRPDRIRGWTLGCDGFVTKPFTVDELVDELIAVAARSPSERIDVRRANLANLTELKEAR